MKFLRAILKGTEKHDTSCFWYEWFTAEEHDTGRILSRVRKYLRKIQVVCEKDVGILAGVVTDYTIFGGIGANR
jgi:hypothetical protein